LLAEILVADKLVPDLQIDLDLLVAEELLDIVEKPAKQKAVGSFAAVQSLMKPD
jgi:hypothetical protein